MRILPHLWQRVFAYALLLVLISHLVSSMLFHFTTRREMHVRFLTEMGIQMASVMKGKDVETFETLATFLEKSQKKMWLEYADGTIASGSPDPHFLQKGRSSLEDLTRDERVSIFRDPKTGSYLARVPLPLEKSNAVICFSFGEPLPPLYLMFFQNIIAVVIIGSALALWITWRIARPLRHLRSEVLQIADGNLENRVSEQGPEEVVQVARAVNSMAHTMINNINSMRKLVADVSHEMRSPLARMNISATIVQEGLDVLAQGQEGGRNPNLLYDAAGTPLACVHIGYILQEIEHMEKLVGSSLLNSRLDFQERMQEAKDVDFSSLCMDIALRHESLFKEKALILNLDIQPLLWVRGDASLLALIISNLLDNAVKAVEEGGFILMKGSKLPQGYEIKVVDNGRGIPKEEIARITEAFYMVDKSRSKKAGGIGLGLALCTQIVKLHGAKMEIKSKPGVGTQIRVIFSEEQ